MLISVALRVRAWIETHRRSLPAMGSTVALRVRAWIETTPGRRCKFCYAVALRVRAWIETITPKPLIKRNTGRPPREGVD